MRSAAVTVYAGATARRSAAVTVQQRETMRSAAVTVYAGATARRSAAVTIQQSEPSTAPIRRHHHRDTLRAIAADLARL